MPTCWPFDERSNPRDKAENIIMLDIDLLHQKKTFNEIKDIIENKKVCSVAGLTFMSALSDVNGNVLQIIPGQGFKYYEKPEYAILTNFSPFKMDKEIHPWMGLDRYRKAEELSQDIKDDFDVSDCFKILKDVSQTICPTVVSMVYDVTDKIVYWCENREWNDIKKVIFERM